MRHEVNTMNKGNEQGRTQFHPIKIGVEWGYASYQQS